MVADHRPHAERADDDSVDDIVEDSAGKELTKLAANSVGAEAITVRRRLLLPPLAKLGGENGGMEAHGS